MDFDLDEHLDRGISSTDKAVLTKPGRRIQPRPQGSPLRGHARGQAL